MPGDPYIPLPEDDESVLAIATDLADYLRDTLPGWESSDASLEVAIGGGFADEGSTLYALLREDATDTFRDFGTDVLGVNPVEATPAYTTTTWTARDDTGYPIDAGTAIIIDAPAGRIAFEVVNETEIPNGDTTVDEVLIQAITPGADANGATGTVLFDAPPAWVESVTVDTPAIGGADGEDDDIYLARVRTEAQLLSRAPIQPQDFELVAVEIPPVNRALVRNLYDDDTSTDDQERTVSIYPVDENGNALSSGVKTQIHDLIAERREVNWIVRVADPTYTDVDVDITVTGRAGADPTDIQTQVEAAITNGPLNPALFGDPQTGARPSWERQTTVYRYEIAAEVGALALVATVDFDLIELNAVADDLDLSGSAPLPRPGTITVTVT